MCQCSTVIWSWAVTWQGLHFRHERWNSRKKVLMPVWPFHIGLIFHRMYILSMSTLMYFLWQHITECQCCLMFIWSLQFRQLHGVRVRVSSIRSLLSIQSACAKLDGFFFSILWNLIVYLKVLWQNENTQINCIDPALPIVIWGFFSNSMRVTWWVIIEW